MKKFKIDDIIRYGSGSTALMKIEFLSKNHGQYGTDRYYGKTFFGSSMGVYHFDIKKASKEDINLWKKIK